MIVIYPRVRLYYFDVFTTQAVSLMLDSSSDEPSVSLFFGEETDEEASVSDEAMTTEPAAEEPNVSIWNTFQEPEGTGGLETIYWFSEGIISDGVEFSLFPPNPPGTPEGGFYDIDISPDSMDPMKGTITWTLKDNKGAGHLVLDEGSYDRYYLILEDSVASASIVEGANLNPKVSVPAYEDKSNIADLFQSGLPFPAVLENNVILLEVQPGGNMTEVGQMMIVEYTLESSDESAEESPELEPYPC